MVGSGIELNSAAKKTHDVLKRAMKSVCLLYYVPLQGPLQEMQQSGEDIFEKVRDLICNLPYNSHLIAALLNLEHDSVSLQDISHLCKFCLR